MKKLYSPRNEVDLSLICSILDGENIPYFVHNNHFGSLRIGPVIELYNAKTIMVDEEDYERAAELIADYLKNTQHDLKNFKSEYSLFDRIRVIIEAFLFGWIVPGKRKRRQQTKEE